MQVKENHNKTEFCRAWNSSYAPINALKYLNVLLLMDLTMPAKHTELNWLHV